MGIHNLTLQHFKLCNTERTLSPLEELILSLGPDFIPKPPPAPDSEIQEAILDYKARVRKKYNQAINGPNLLSRLQRLYLADIEFTPQDVPCTSRHVENYLRKVEYNFTRPAIDFTYYTNKILPKREYNACLKHLRTQHKNDQHVPIITLINNPQMYKGHIAANATRNNPHHLLLPLAEDSVTPICTVTSPPGDLQQNNLTKIICEVVKNLRNDKSIIINNTDKNLGLAIMPTEWYKEQALSHLMDPLNYRKLNSFPLATDAYDELMHALKRINKLEPKSEQFKYIFQLDPRINKAIAINSEIKSSKFYMLPKVHKPKIATRPIVASMGSLTYNASKLVDFYLQKVMRFFPSILLNSQELNRHLALTIYPKNCILYSADVTALYPSIDIIDGINNMGKAILLYNEQVAEDERIDAEYIITLSTWILNNNYITFGTSKWKQISGTAMGTPMAVVFANLYLLILEKETQELLTNDKFFNPLRIYVRFIDDIFVIADPYSGNLFLNTLNNRRERIKLEITQGNTVNYLDLTMYITEEDSHNIIDVQIYQKPMNQYLYIPIFSYHQIAIFNAFITAEIKRYKLSCSKESDFQSTCNLFKQRLMVRGYPKNKYDELLNKITCSRNDLLFKDCKKYYEMNYHDLPVNVIAPFVPFRKDLLENNQEDTQLIFKLSHTPRFSNKELKTNLDMAPFKEEFSYDRFPFATKQFQGVPLLCKKRTMKIQDILIRSEFQQDLPSNFGNKDNPHPPNITVTSEIICSQKNNQTIPINDNIPVNVISDSNSHQSFTTPKASQKICSSASRKVNLSGIKLHGRNSQNHNHNTSIPNNFQMQFLEKIGS